MNNQSTKENNKNKSINIGFKRIIIIFIAVIVIRFLYSSFSVRNEDEVFNELGQTFHQDYAVYTVSSGDGFIFDIKNEEYSIGVNSFIMLSSDTLYSEDTYYHPDFIEVVNQVKFDMVTASEIAGRGYYIHLSNSYNEDNYIVEAVNGELTEDYLTYGDGTSTLD